MRVTCKHCGGAHPAFECRKKSTAARIERAEAAGGLQTAQSPNGVAIDDHLKPTEAKQQASSAVDQPSQALPVDTNSRHDLKASRSSGPADVPKSNGKQRAQVTAGETAPKFDRKAWMREYQRNYMRNVYRPKLKASKSNPNTPREERQVRLTPDEKMLSALADIADFKPKEGDGDPYQQIAVYAKARATEAIREYVRHDTVLYRPFLPREER